MAHVRLDDDEDSDVTGLTTEHGGSRPGVALPADHATPKPVKQLLKELLVLALPIVFTYLLSFGTLLVTIIFVGHVSDDSSMLAAVGSGTMLANITGFSTGIGLMTAFDTLAAQAYGARQFRKVGVLAQRSAVVLTVLTCFIVLLWSRTEHLLLLAHQPEEVSRLAAKYLSVMRLAPPAYMAFELLKRYLQIQSITRPMLVITLVVNIIHPFTCWLYLVKWDLGIEGAAYANVTALWMLALLLVAYILIWRPHNPATWAGFAWREAACTDMGLYLKLGVAGAAMLCLEWWAFEALSLMAGALSIQSLAVHTIFSTLVPLCFMLPLGLSVASSVLIGNALGSGHPVQARQTARTAAWCAIVEAAAVALVLFAVRAPLPELIVSGDEEVTSRASRMEPIISLFVFMDSFQGVYQGIFRGAGKQNWGVVITVFGFYVVSLPLAYVGGFVLDYDVEGLWGGNVCGYVVVALLYIFASLRIKWDVESVKARQRAVDSMCSDDTQGSGSGSGSGGGGDAAGAGHVVVLSADAGSSPSKLDDHTALLAADDGDAETKQVELTVL